MLVCLTEPLDHSDLLWMNHDVQLWENMTTEYVSERNKKQQNVQGKL